MNNNQEVHDAVDGKNYEVHVAIVRSSSAPYFGYQTSPGKVNNKELFLFHRVFMLLMPISNSANTQSDHNVASEWVTEVWHGPL